jgi:hypothetical protein
LVTTSDRIAIPPIQHFRQLVHQMLGIESASENHVLLIANS